ncbi:MAG TPA: dihydroorotase [Chitinophagaceae bacterium]|nr:dihydroorotase [Chitinophagaceae bacterium]
MQKYLIKDIGIVNEGSIVQGDVHIQNGRIEKIGSRLSAVGASEIDGSGKFLLPGAIDDQVHFREPGLTHKANIYTESRAAVAGGVTTFMEMPNTMPPVFNQQLLEEKYAIASRTSLANYSFFMGTSNENAGEALKTNQKKHDVCGIKIFMGSSTGGLLVDNYLTLNKLFSESEVLIATHCEDERVIKKNYQDLKLQKPVLEAADHPIIRNTDACFESSFAAIQLAKKHDARLHILHISTEKELQLFSNMMPLHQKRITAEVCVHHLHFTADDYARLGYAIKCNPAIKAAHNREALWDALLDDRLDVIATDHAPHTMEEKGLERSAAEHNFLSRPNEEGLYERTHAGLPLVQHSMALMLYYVRTGRLTIQKLAEKMSHAVATCFQIENRGFIREGYWADVVIVNMDKPNVARAGDLLYKCGWSPLEGFEFPAGIEKTFVNGHLAYDNGTINESQLGMRLKFNR